MAHAAEEEPEVETEAAVDESPEQDKAVETEGEEQTEGTEEAAEEAPEGTTTEEGEQEQQDEPDPEIEEVKGLIEKFKIEPEALKLPGVRKALKSQRELEKVAGRKRELPDDAKVAMAAYDELRQMIQGDPEFASVLQKQVQKHRRIVPAEDPMQKAKRLREEAIRLNEAGKVLDAAERIAEAKILEDPNYREFQESQERSKRERVDAERRELKDAERKVEEQWSAFESQHGDITPELEAAMAKTLESMPLAQRPMVDLEDLYVLTQHRMKKNQAASKPTVKSPAPRSVNGGRTPPKAAGAIRSQKPKDQPIPQDELDALSSL